MRVKDLILLEATDSPHWFKPNFDAELDEFERVADDLHVSVETLERLYRIAQIKTLDGRAWQRLSNTDSNEERWRGGDVEAADLFLKNNYEKDNLKGIIQTIKRNGKLPMPIIIHKDNTDMLVAGNTRLMACSLLNIKDPKVVYVVVGKQ